MTQQKSAWTSTGKRLYRPWSVHTVVVKLSRKLTATYRIRAERCLSRLLATLLAVASTWSMATLPTGLNVVAGQATTSAPNANSLQVNQATDKAILNWQTFNIGVGKSVQFVQPAATSVALNRIVGNEASSIYGSLSANGQVFLVNPAGVMFAPGAQVNVGGLVASSLAIGNEDFMAGRYTFSGSGGGAVDNHGTINAARGGYVLLTAPKVTNSGSITADAGSVGLLAGSRVTLDTSGTGLVRFSVDAAAAHAAIANSGSIAAKGGQVAVLASAVGDAMATVINQTGVIRADSAVERNGMIVLSGGSTGVVTVAGTLSAAGLDSGLTGGTVQVLGDKVLLAPGTRIDASGQIGGGTVLVGGDYQGSNAAVQNASRVYVAAGASVNADATVNGNGGKVVVWADGDTRFAGSISARGGAQGGDGGFVEVSGKRDLDVQGGVDVTAPHGKGGTVLFDPTDIVLAGAGANVPPNNAGTPDVAFADTPAAYNIQITPAIRGYDELWLQATNSITVNSALAMNTGNRVRFETNGAGSSININAALSASGGVTLNSAGSVNSNATGTISASGVNGVLGTASGNVSITAATTVNLLAAVTATGGSSTGANNAGAGGGSVSIQGGTGVQTVAITASGGNGGANGAGGNAGNIGITNTTSGAISTGALTSQTGAAVGTGAGGNAGFVTVTNNAAGQNVTTSTLLTTGGAKGAGGNINVTATGSGAVITNGTAMTANGGAGVGSAGTNAGNITLNGGTVTLAASVLTASGGAGNGASFAGGNGGEIRVTSNVGGMSSTLTGAMTANGGAASATAAAGGAAGLINAVNAAASTGVVDLRGSGGLNARTGASAGATAAGAVGSITVNNNAATATATTLAALSTSGQANGNGGAVNITTTGTLELAGINASNGTGGTLRGDVTLLAGSAITQSGAIVTRNLSATTASAAGAAITLSNASNDAIAVNLQVRDGTTAAVGANNTNAAIAYTDLNAVAVSGINNGTGAGGNVTLLAGAALTQTGAINAATLTATTANATAGTGLITLTNASNTATAVNLQARAGTVGAIGPANVATAIQYTGAGAVAVSGINSGTGAGGNVTLLAGGAITQTAAIKALTLTATTANAAGVAITLDHTGNDATTVNLQVRDGTVAAVGAANAAVAIQYTDSTAVAVSGINSGTGAGGNVTLLAGAALTQTGAINAATLTATTANATAGTGLITLTNAGNTATAVNLQARAGTVGAIGPANVATAIQYTGAGAVAVSGINSGTGAGGNVTLLAGGAITQSGAIKAGMLTATTASAAGSAITLTNTGNDAATVNLQVRGGTVAAVGAANAAAAISYTDTNAVIISGVNNGTGAGGNLTLAATGNITQSGVVNAAQLSATLTGGASALNLGTQANNIAQLNAITTPGGFTLTNGNNTVAINAAISSTNNNVAITSGSGATTFGAGGSIASGGGSVTLTNTNAAKVLGNIDTTGGTGTGNFAVAGVGVITQAAATALKVKGTTAIAAGATNNVTLTNAGNDFTGAVSVTNGNNVSITDANALVLGASTVSGTLNVNAGGSVTQTGAVNAAQLTAALTGSTSALNLGSFANNIAQLNAITTPGGFTLTNGNNNVLVNNNITATNNAVLIDAGTGSYTQNNFDISAGTGAITVIANTVAIVANTGGNALTTSGTLTLKPKAAGRAMSLGAGAVGFDMSTAEITSLSTGATGPIVIGDTTSTGAMTIGAVVNLAGKTLTLNAGSMADTGLQTITAQNVTLNANGLIGTSAANGIDIAATNLSVNTTGNANAFVRTGAINLGAGSSSVGSGTLDLTATGAVTQTGNITAGTLNVKTLANAGAAITLTNSANDAAVINLKTRDLADGANVAGAIQYTDATGFDVAAIATTGNATLSAGGGVTQSGAVAATGLALTGTGGAYTLSNAGNAVTTLAANTGSINYKQAGALAVGTVGTVGVTTTGVAQIETTAAGSNLTLNNAVTSSATGDAVILKAGSANAAGTSTGGQLINNAGTGGIVASSGRYLVYSGDPGPGFTTEGVTGYAKLYNTGASFVPAGTASTFVYRIAPTLVVTANAGSKVYDGAAPTLTFGTTGLIDGDTASTALAGILTRAGGKNVLGGDAVTIGTLAAQMGYGITYTGANYSVTPAALTATASAPNKVYDANTTSAATLNITAGLVGTETVTATGAATFNTQNVATANLVTVNSNTLANGTNGGLASNYSLTTGQTVAANITAKALTATASAPNKVYDGNTTAAATLAIAPAGFVGTQTVTATGAATFNTKNVATANLVTVNSTALADGTNGGLASNYSLAAGQTAAASITPASIASVSGITAANKVQDGSTAATLLTSNAAFNGKVTGDVLTVATANGAFDTAAVGTGKLVSISGITLGGADAGNYNLANTAATTTANILSAGAASTASTANTASSGAANSAASLKAQLASAIAAWQDASGFQGCKTSSRSSLAIPVPVVAVGGQSSSTDLSCN